MRLRVLSCSFVCLLGLASQAFAEKLTRLPKGTRVPVFQGFVRNEGQWASNVRFLVRGAGTQVWITDTGLEYDSYKPGKPKAQSVPPFNKIHPKMGELQKLVMSFARGAHPTATGLGLESAKFNFYTSRNHDQWREGVKVYSQALLKNVYPGVDARYYFDHSALRYDLIVHPGADLSNMAMKFNGAKSLKVLPNGNLRIGTSNGELEERNLAAYQVCGKSKAPVSCRMVAKNGEVRFVAGRYDKKAPLVIDPLLFSRFIPGGAGDTGLYQDGSGNILLFGDTFDTLNIDLIEPNGVLVNSTSLTILPIGAAMDSVGNLILYANTGAVYGDEPIPTTPGSFEPTDPGGLAENQTGGVVKLRRDGTLVFGTYINGTATTTPAGDYYGTWEVGGIAVDAFDNIIVSGMTFCTDFPVTQGSLITTNPVRIDNQSMPNGTGFVAKLSSDGSQLLFGTYLGGSTSGDFVLGMALDPQGNVLLSGKTYSTDFPITSNAYQKSNNAGPYGTGFVAKLSSDGTSLLFSTFLGGSGQPDQANNFEPLILPGDTPTALAFDPSGNVLVTGLTNSPDFPVTAGAYQGSYLNANGDEIGFVSRLSSDGSHLLSSTYFGDTVSNSATNGPTYPMALAQDSSGNVGIAGMTAAYDIPTSPDAFQPQNNCAPNTSASQNNFVAELSSDLTSLRYSTYIGGTDLGYGVEPVFGIIFDAFGNAIISGFTSDPDYPVTFGAIDGPQNFFYSQISIPSFTLSSNNVILTSPMIEGGGRVTGTVTIADYAASGGAKVTLTSSNPSIVPLPASVTIPAGSVQQSFTIHTNSTQTVTTVQLRSSYGGQNETVLLTVTPSILHLTALYPNPVMTGASDFVVTATGLAFASGDTIDWNGAPLSTTFVSSQKLTATISASLVATAGNFTITVVDQNGNASDVRSFVVENAAPVVSSTSPTQVTSGGQAFTLTVYGSNFVPGSTVKWSGKGLPTTFVSSTKLQATVSSTFIKRAGTAEISVATPKPGGGISNAVTITKT